MCVCLCVCDVCYKIVCISCACVNCASVSCACVRCVRESSDPNVSCTLSCTSCSVARTVHILQYLVQVVN